MTDESSAAGAPCETAPIGIVSLWTPLTSDFAFTAYAREFEPAAGLSLLYMKNTTGLLACQCI